MKNVLICGASGFMGRNIANSFLKTGEYNVYGVGKKRVVENINDYKMFFTCDLTSKQGIDHVFNRGVCYDIVIQAAATTSGAGSLPSIVLGIGGPVPAFDLQAFAPIS